MRTLLASASIFLFSCLSFGQSASYGFEGALDPAQREQLETRCAAITGVSWVKCRYKDDLLRGELLIEPTPARSHAEADQDHFSPVFVKQLLLEFGLQPLEYVSLKKD